MLRLKPVAQAVGLVAVLVMVLALSGLTQDGSLRDEIVRTVDEALAQALVAAEDVILDPNAVTLLSDVRATIGFIPLHSVEWANAATALSTESYPVTVGAIFFSSPTSLKDKDGGTVPIKQGLYTVQIVDSETAMLIDDDGQAVVSLNSRFRVFSIDEGSPFTKPYVQSSPPASDEETEKIEFLFTVDDFSQIGMKGQKEEVISAGGRGCLCWVLLALALLA